MKSSEIRKLSDNDITNKIKECKEEIFKLKLKQASGNLEKTARIDYLRKTVARLKTIENERKVGENHE